MSLCNVYFLDNSNSAVNSKDEPSLYSKACFCAENDAFSDSSTLDVSWSRGCAVFCYPTNSSNLDLCFSRANLRDSSRPWWEVTVSSCRNRSFHMFNRMTALFCVRAKKDLTGRWHSGGPILLRWSAPVMGLPRSFIKEDFVLQMSI